MNQISFLQNQIRETRDFTNQLISEVPSQQWFEIPPNSNSNIAWQISHIIMAQNYHAISCIHGPNDDVFKIIPVAKLAKHIGGLGSKDRSINETLISKQQIEDYAELIFNKCLSLMDELTVSDLTQPLYPTPFRNPIALNKYEALSWSFKHEMWHCAEIEQIKNGFGFQHQWIRNNS